MAQPTKKKPTTAVVAWEQQMAQAATAQAAVEQVTGSFKSINTRSGILSVDDTPLKNNELRCVILASAFENQLYEGAYNPNQLSVPACFAISLDGEAMQPHENSQNPQCDNCEACELYVMGSADTGRGKACKNIRRLLLLTEDSLESAELLAEAEARMLKVSVTSVKNWSKDVNSISEDMQRPSWGVVTLIKLVPDAKTQFKMLFTFEELVQFDQELFDAMQKKIAELNKDIIAPYAVPSEEESAPPPRKGKAAPAAKGKAGPAARKTTPAAKRSKF